MESNAATQVNGCLAAGSGVRIPAWRAPWKGYDGCVTCPSAPVAAVAASAFAPPISTPPASAVPAAPERAPLRKLRRLVFTTVQAPSLLSVGRWYFKEIRNGRGRLQLRSDGRVDVLARGQWRRAERGPRAVRLRRPGCEQGLVERVQLGGEGGDQAGLPRVDQRRQVAEDRAGDLDVGVRLGERGAAALVVNAGQVVAQRVLEAVLEAVQRR